jgi:hypothetical protein
VRAEGFRFVTLPELRDEGSTSHATGT